METISDHHKFLEQQSTMRNFLKYLVPSLLGMLLTIVNYFIDGIMVGNKIGQAAFAAVGVAGPVYTLFVAISVGVGVGGATLYSQAMGSKRYERAQKIYTHSVVTICVTTLLLVGTAYIFRDSIPYFLGATSDTYTYVTDYMNIILLFGIVLTVENALSVFIRNDGNPNLSMIGLSTTAVLNIILNWLFLYVFELGIIGVAVATIIASFIGLCVLSLHFLRERSNLKLVKYKFNKKMLFSIIFVGFPSFLVESAVILFVVSFNNVLKTLAGSEGVAAFTAIHYTHSAALLTFMGIGLAIQPLISYYQGAGIQQRITKTVNIAVVTALAFGVVFICIIQFFTRPILNIFGDFSEGVFTIAERGLKIFVLSYLFMGVNFVMMVYYQAAQKVWIANCITAAREIVLMLVFLFTLPRIWGINGVWLSIPMAECIVLVCVFIYHTLEKKRLTYR